MKKTFFPVFISLAAFCSLLCGCNASTSSQLATETEAPPSVAIESTVTTPVYETLIGESIGATEATLPTETISTTQIPDVPSEQTEAFIEDNEDSLGWS